MAGDKSKRGGQDRSRVATGEPYEVDYFARKHGLPRNQAERIIKAAGGDRDKADAEARKVNRP